MGVGGWRWGLPEGKREWPCPRYLCLKLWVEGGRGVLLSGHVSWELARWFTRLPFCDCERFPLVAFDVTLCRATTAATEKRLQELRSCWHAWQNGQTTAVTTMTTTATLHSSSIGSHGQWTRDCNCLGLTESGLAEGIELFRWRVEKACRSQPEAWLLTVLPLPPPPPPPTPPPPTPPAPAPPTPPPQPTSSLVSVPVTQNLKILEKSFNLK